jgi:pimeloyl-ACP methyl ester carboxylesterase
MAYVPIKTPQQLTIRVRELDYCLNCWGDERAPPLFLLHGWADTGMTFQFLADAMSGDWRLIAPDWRGFGGTAWSRGGYWFPDYLADLDALLEQLSPDRPVCLIGHSMGGNVAWLYAGIRPQRVSHAVALDVFGLPDAASRLAPERYGQWLEQCRDGTRFSEYPDRGAVAEKLLELAPRLPRDNALYLADHWSRKTPGGTYTVNADPAHKRVNPVLYRREETRSCWRCITARTMLVMAADSFLYRRYREENISEELRSCIETLEETVVPGAGHMVHQERPEAVAAIIGSFLRGD